MYSTQNTEYDSKTKETSQKNCTLSIETTTTLNKTQMLPPQSPTSQALKTTKTTTKTINETIARCDGRCFAERRIHCRELAKWGRPMLLTLVGLENVFQRALGPLQWRKYCKAVKASISSPKDFCFIEETNCDWCLNARTAATGYDSCPTMNESLLSDDCVSISRYSTVNNSTLASTSTSTTLTAASSSNNLTPTSSASAVWNSQLLALSFINSMRQQNGDNFPSTLPFSAFHPIVSGCEQQQQFLPSVSSDAAWNSQLFAHCFKNSIQNWNSQLFALSFINSLQQQNGFNFPSTLPFPTVYPPIISGCEQQNQQQLFPSVSSEAFFSFLEQKIQQREYSPPTPQQSSFSTGNTEFSISSQKINGDEQPLDLSAKSSALNDSTSKKCSPQFGISFLGAGGDSHSITGNQPQQIRASSSNFNDMDEEIQGVDHNGNTNYKSGVEKIEANCSNFDDSNEAILSNSKTVGLKKYSQADLDAAVSDIRLGRLGTRRASVVYGIPRSTLRNKIYKLEAADELLTNGLDYSNNSRHKRLAVFALHKQERQRITTSISSSSTIKLKNETNHKIRNKKYKFNDFEKNREDNLSEKEIKNETETLNENIETSTVQQHQNLNNLIPSASTVLPIVNELCNSNVSVTSITTETLFKEITSQLGHFVGQSSDVNEFNNNNISSEPSPSNYCDIDMEKYYQDHDIFDPKMKGKRQKRGQYRKYNKDALDKAVLAVRAGQMSVHRAGSHFGVPHSTLEYKVKERNLLRIKNKKQCARTTHLQLNTSPDVNLQKEDSSTLVKD